MTITNNIEELECLKIRTCKQCNQEKILSEFYQQKKKRKDGIEYIYYHTVCKKCRISNAKGWIDENYNKQLEYVAKYSSKPDVRNKIYLSNKKRLEENKYLDWLRNNKDKIKKYGLNRDMHKKHDISKNEWLSCKEYFNNSCAYCGLPIEEHYNQYKGKIKLTDFHKEHIDHEGTNDLSNCVPSCKVCNSKKHTSKLDEWYNKDNGKYSKRRHNKILKWLNEDYLKYKE